MQSTTKAKNTHPEIKSIFLPKLSITFAQGLFMTDLVVLKLDPSSRTLPLGTDLSDSIVLFSKGYHDFC